MAAVASAECPSMAMLPAAVQLVLWMWYCNRAATSLLCDLSSPCPVTITCCHEPVPPAAVLAHMCSTSSTRVCLSHTLRQKAGCACSTSLLPRVWGCCFGCQALADLSSASIRAVLAVMLMPLRSDQRQEKTPRSSLEGHDCKCLLADTFTYANRVRSELHARHKDLVPVCWNQISLASCFGARAWTRANGRI